MFIVDIVLAIVCFVLAGLMLVALNGHVEVVRTDAPDHSAKPGIIVFAVSATMFAVAGGLYLSPVNGLVPIIPIALGFALPFWFEDAIEVEARRA